MTRISGNEFHQRHHPLERHDAGADGTAADSKLVSEAARHVDAIRALAEEVSRPFEEITSIYQEELARVEAYATVRDYLPVLVAKRVRALYQRRLTMLRRHAPYEALVGEPSGPSACSSPGAAASALSLSSA